MASSPQKNLQFISPPEAGDFLQNQVKEIRTSHDGRTPPVTAPANHEPRTTSNKKAVANATAFLIGDPSEIRTRDTLIKSQVLYQLS